MRRLNRNDYERIGEPFHQILRNSGPDEVTYDIYGYRHNSCRLVWYHIFSILLGGIPYVIFNLYPKYGVLKYQKCSLRTADLILVSYGHGNYCLITVDADDIIIPNRGPTRVRSFSFQHSKYVWDYNENVFVALEGFISPDTLNEMLDNDHGLTPVEYFNRSLLYGPNKIEVQVKSYWQLFKEEVFNPFYIFQAFSVILWCFDDYVSYALCVLVLTLFSAISSLIQTRKQSKVLHDLVESAKTHKVKVLRPKYLEQDRQCEIDPECLVPGDLMILPSTGIVMPCDALLLSGHCIVNESMLTGESVPITKIPPYASTEEFNLSFHKRHILFCGTEVIQTRYYGGKPVLARVVRTGFSTSKGSLIKSILYPTPVGLQFYKDSLKFVFVLFVIAAFGMGYCLYLYILRGAEVEQIILRTLDIITIVVPPALPAAMTIGTVYSQNRLKKLKIFCTSPPRINVCGKIKLACFDKTGTLTEDGLKLHSVVPCEKAEFKPTMHHEETLNARSSLVQAMACCHSLTRIGGKLTGDPLDLTMFESINWVLEEPEVPETAIYDLLAPTVVKPNVPYSDDGTGDTDEINPYEIGIIRQFPFSSAQQSMSVICRHLGSPNMIAFMKGAPEKVVKACCTETVPADFGLRLRVYTAQGFRVIALAYKPLPPQLKWKEAQKVKREVIECDLIFVGLLIMQNALKPETTPVIRCLSNACIRTLMITGDNLYTAITVARECEMINPETRIFRLIIEFDHQNHTHKLLFEDAEAAVEAKTGERIETLPYDCYTLAIDGTTWNSLRKFYPDAVDDLLVRTTVFARFQPDQKTQLVTSFQKLDYVVTMVGDGANDCGALKAAHVGVSLSQTEASVAAPFTSSIQNISCVAHLMLEGRCALVTSFAVFKYMALYSLIQFFTILILYKHHSILGDYQFLFIDLVITTSLAVTIGRQGPGHVLVPKRPMGSLVSTANLLPLILQVATCLLVQLGCLWYLQMQHWFVPLPPGKEEVVKCWENTVLFTVSCFQYIILACVYSKGKPYREPLITNLWFLVFALALTSFTTWLIVLPFKELAEFFEVIHLSKHDPYSKWMFRYSLVLFPIAHLLIAFFIEICIADRDWLKHVIHFIMRKKRPKNKYKLLLQADEFYGKYRNGF